MDFTKLSYGFYQPQLCILPSSVMHFTKLSYGFYQAQLWILPSSVMHFTKLSYGFYQDLLWISRLFVAPADVFLAQLVDLDLCNFMQDRIEMVSCIVDPLFIFLLTPSASSRISCRRLCNVASLPTSLSPADLISFR